MKCKSWFISKYQHSRIKCLKEKGHKGPHKAGYYYDGWFQFIYWLKGKKGNRRVFPQHNRNSI